MEAILVYRVWQSGSFHWHSGLLFFSRLFLCFQYLEQIKAAGRNVRTKERLKSCSLVQGEHLLLSNVSGSMLRKEWKTTDTAEGPIQPKHNSICGFYFIGPQWVPWGHLAITRHTQVIYTGTEYFKAIECRDCCSHCFVLFITDFYVLCGSCWCF